jgi:hypothetical protein
MDDAEVANASGVIKRLPLAIVMNERQRLQLRTPKRLFRFRPDPAVRWHERYVSSSIRRASRCNARIARIRRSDSAEYNPCFVLARRIRSNPAAVRGPVLLPPCNLQRPFAIAGDRHAFPFRVFAPQRGHACARGNVVRQSGSRCTGLSLAFSAMPHGRSPVETEARSAARRSSSRGSPKSGPPCPRCANGPAQSPAGGSR